MPCDKKPSAKKRGQRVGCPLVCECTALLAAADVVAEGLGAAGELAGGGAGGLAHGAGHRADLVARDLLGRSTSALLDDRGLLEAYGSGLVGCSGNLAARFLPCRRGSLRGAAELLFLELQERL